MAELLDSLTDAAATAKSAAPSTSPADYSGTDTRQSGKFLLTAEWRNLVMLNFDIDPDVLATYVPPGTELDLFEGRAIASVVGFEFLRARWCGLAIPMHGNFPEVNLRFYVKRLASSGWRRGVVFIKEIAPRWMVAQVARRVYHENYCCRPMRHEVATARGADTAIRSAKYKWYECDRWNWLALATSAEISPCERDTQAAFVVERNWCFTAQPNGTTREYLVEHPPWPIAPAIECELACDIARVYGRQFVACLSATPTSAFLVDGSAVVVHPGSVV